METDQETCALLPLAAAEGLLRQCGELRFVVRGGSMIPQIYPGDEVIVRSADISEIEKGQIVLFSRNSRWFVHRVHQILPAGEYPLLQTQGDALVESDPMVSGQELLGRVDYVIRHGEWRRVPAADSLLRKLFGILVRYVPHLPGACVRWHEMGSRRAAKRTVAVQAAHRLRESQ